ncbi:adenosine deaminase [Arcanobacterium hippocoleae]|uniref:adenosine deaminase n=1 Tax=Arcanobacterium hippocoleae TaxID=149017 RepID=A0ABU1T135_9ACTO|nr:adenosine deaminase [Arcanobacterium hippocoleae]MDR6938566.1 adenosine deaminase [Arcanobacterium hippocoleae]
MLDSDLVRSLPKVVLHDHLDGGLRVQTVLELAREIDLVLPADDPSGLSQWFYDAANSGSLPRYLETFQITVALMQSPQALRRIAYECVEDLVADGVVYAEVRWAPELHLHNMEPREAVAAVWEGLQEGMRAMAAAGHVIHVRQILTALRHHPPSTQTAQLVIDCADLGVVGYDIAGPEAGYRATVFRESTDLLRKSGCHITIHAGEGYGPESIQDAINCGAERIGHGVRIIEDGSPLPGSTRRQILDRDILLEVCPTSNLQTGIASSIFEHPVDRLVSAGFRVGINCDNRLMSRTSLTRELLLLHDAFQWDLLRIEEVTVAAMESAFCAEALKAELIRDVIQPAFAAFTDC